MDDEPRNDADRALQVQLEVHLEHQPVTGRLRTGWGADEPFLGWLGFVEALRRLQARGPRSIGPRRCE
jgi:hypothetical protein